MVLGFDASLPSPSPHRKKLTLPVRCLNPTKPVVFKDGGSCSVYDLALVPGTGSKYFLGACDQRIKIFDMDEERVCCPSIMCPPPPPVLSWYVSLAWHALQVIQLLDIHYDSNADFVSFFQPWQDISSSVESGEASSPCLWFVTRGVPALNPDGTCLCVSLSYSPLFCP